MGKFVLGIIAVTLLQIAFLVYLAKDSPAGQSVATIGNSSAPLIRPSDNSDQEVTRSASVAVDIPTPAEGESKRTTLPRERRSKTSAESSTRVSQRHRAKMQVDTAARVRSHYPSDQIISSGRHSPAVPRGHTMVLVDNLPLAKSYSRSQTPSVVRRDVESFEIEKPRKRSYLAKAFRVVKKPWDWAKSLGSKLD